MSVIKPKSWAEYEAERIDLGLSRADLLRRAGVSETTMFKGLQAHERWLRLVAKGDRTAERRGAPKPQQHLQSKLDRELDLARQMAALGASIERRVGGVR